MIAIILIFIDKHNFFSFMIGNTNKLEAMASSMEIYMTQGEIIFNCITSILMLVSVIATVFSGYNYLKNGKNLFKEDN